MPSLITLYFFKIFCVFIFSNGRNDQMERITNGDNLDSNWTRASVHKVDILKILSLKNLKFIKRSLVIEKIWCTLYGCIHL